MRVIFFFLTLALVLSVSAQSDRKKVELSFSGGASYGMLFIKQAPFDSIRNLPYPHEILDSLSGITTTNRIGTKFGGAMKINLSESFAITPKFEIGFYKSQYQFHFDSTNFTPISHPIGNSIDIIIHAEAKISKGERIVYAQVGPYLRKYPQIAFSSAIVDIEQVDIGLDIGLSTEVDAKYFKLCPELRYSFGLRNLAIKNDLPVSPAVDRLLHHNVSLIFQIRN